MKDASESWPVAGLDKYLGWPTVNGMRPEQVHRELWPAIWRRLERYERHRARGLGVHEALRKAGKVG